MMVEPLIYVSAIVVFWLTAMFCHSMNEDRPFRQIVLDALCIAGAMYFAVQFVRWAWESPLPFLGKR
jgi:hypothetical protein